MTLFFKIYTKRPPVVLIKEKKRREKETSILPEKPVSLTTVVDTYLKFQAWSFDQSKKDVLGLYKLVLVSK